MPPPVEPVPRPPRWSPVELLPPVVSLLLGTVLLLRGHALWFDELFTAEVSRLSPAGILAAVAAGEGTTSYLAEIGRAHV